MPTINDVARHAGVSRSTVSLVLNKSPLVKDSTRELVERVISELNYVPNNNARGLSANVTNNLGIIFIQDYLPSQNQILYDNNQHVGLCSHNISNGISAGLIGTDYGVITERFCSIAAPKALPRVIQEKRVDGAFIVGVPYSDQFIQNMARTGIPFVVVGVGSYEENVDSIWADPGEGTELAVQELLRTGHKNICLLNCSTGIHSHKWRAQGYLRAMEAYGVQPPPLWNVSVPSNNGQSAYIAFRHFWEAGNRPDAVVTANGQMAAGILNYLYEQHIRVPDDISIIAYEDSSLCGYAAPPITSINIRKEELGKQAVQCLLARLQDPAKEIQHYSLKPYLVQRRSVRPLAEDA